MKSTAWIFAGLMACGGGSGDGGSGVDGDREMVTLSTSEIADVCEYVTTVLPERVVECSDGPVTVGEGGLAECTGDYTDLPNENPDCGLTVSQVEGCAEAIAALSDDEICTGEAFPPACAPILDSACL